MTTSSTFRVLIIADERDIREVARLGLEIVSGWDVDTAANGPDGVRRAAAAPPDAILLDVMMPDVDGPETLRRLRAEPVTAAVPVVFLTARTQTADLEWLRNLGAAGVIAKPFDPVTLGDELAGLLGREVP